MTVKLTDGGVLLNLEISGSKFSNFGSLSIKQGLDGNYTGSVKLNSGLDSVLFDGLKASAKSGRSYYLRTGDLLTSNSPVSFHVNRSCSYLSL